MSKIGGPIVVEMIETDDVLAELGAMKADRWVMGFALEAQNPRENALQKLRKKNCDWIVLNHPSAIAADTNDPLTPTNCMSALPSHDDDRERQINVAGQNHDYESWDSQDDTAATHSGQGDAADTYLNGRSPALFRLPP